MVDRVTIQSPESGFEAPAADTPASTETTNTERPAWLPEGFDTPEAFAEHYKTLTAEKAVAEEQSAPDESASEEEAPAEDTEEKPEGEGNEEQEKPEETGDPVRDLLTAKGVDYDELNDQFASDGKLSDENYAKLTEAGYPKELVDNYLEGERLRAEATNTRLYSIVGGEDQFKVMATWAGADLPKAEVENLNKAFSSGNAASAEMAMATLKMKYEAANGRVPKLVGGKGKGGAPADVFKSAAEVSAAINNPKYRADPAYRAEVADKIARSNVI